MDVGINTDAVSAEKQANGKTQSVDTKPQGNESTEETPSREDAKVIPVVLEIQTTSEELSSMANSIIYDTLYNDNLYHIPVYCYMPDTSTEAIRSDYETHIQNYDYEPINVKLEVDAQSKEDLIKEITQTIDSIKEQLGMISLSIDNTSVEELKALITEAAKHKNIKDTQQHNEDAATQKNLADAYLKANKELYNVKMQLLTATTAEKDVLKETQKQLKDNLKNLRSQITAKSQLARIDTDDKDREIEYQKDKGLFKEQQKQERAAQRQAANEATRAAKQQAHYDAILNANNRLMEIAKEKLVAEGAELQLLEAEEKALTKQRGVDLAALRIEQLKTKAIQDRITKEREAARYVTSKTTRSDKAKTYVADFKKSDLTRVQQTLDGMNTSTMTTDGQKYYQETLKQLEAIRQKKEDIAKLPFISAEDEEKFKSDLKEMYQELDNQMRLYENNGSVYKTGVTSAQAMMQEFEKLKQVHSDALNIKVQGNKFIATIEDANGAVRTITYTFHKTAQAINQTERVAQKSGTAVEKFVSSLAAKWQDLARYMLSFGSFYEILNLFKTGFNVIREMDLAMVQVRKVSDGTTETYRNFEDELSQTAKQIASTNVELRNSAADWLRLGETIEDAGELAKNAAVYVNVGDGIDIDTATSDMIIAMRANLMPLYTEMCT